MDGNFFLKDRLVFTGKLARHPLVRGKGYILWCLVGFHVSQIPIGQLYKALTLNIKPSILQGDKIDPSQSPSHTHSKSEGWKGGSSDADI